MSPRGAPRSWSAAPEAGSASSPTSTCATRSSSADVSRHAPVTDIMTTPVHTIGAEMLAPEASIAMMAAGVNHLPVLDDDGNVVGIVSASNLMTLEARSPFALRRSIMGRATRRSSSPRRRTCPSCSST